MAGRNWSSERGTAGIALTVVIAWALGAVLLLTTTLITVQTIDARVADITGETAAIDKDTDNVRLLDTTEETAAGILKAAEPLSGQLDTITATAKSIDGHVLDIQGNVESIQSSVNSILGNANGILATSQSIDAGAAAINRRADVIIGLVRAIKADTNGILGQVGEIDQHAASIDCHTGGTGGFPECVLDVATGPQERTTPSSTPNRQGGLEELVGGLVDDITEDLGNLLSGVPVGLG